MASKKDKEKPADPRPLVPGRLAQALDILAKNKPKLESDVGLLFVKAGDGYSVVPVTRATYITNIQRSEGRAVRSFPSLMMSPHHGGPTPEAALEAFVAAAGWGPGAEPIMPATGQDVPAPPPTQPEDLPDFP